MCAWLSILVILSALNKGTFFYLYLAFSTDYSCGQVVVMLMEHVYPSPTL